MIGQRWGRKGTRFVLTPDGYGLVYCPGCEAPAPLRSVPGRETLDAYNWVRTCAQCGERLCLVCLDPAATVCHACQHAAPDASAAASAPASEPAAADEAFDAWEFTEGART